MMQLRCGHVMHHDCARKWIGACVGVGNYITCPMCRAGMAFEPLALSARHFFTPTGEVVVFGSDGRLLQIITDDGDCVFVDMDVQWMVEPRLSQ